MDGATQLQALLHILLPLARPMLAVVYLFTFIAIYAEYIISSLVLSSQDWVTQTLTTVQQPIAEKGRTAARLLIARLEGDPVKSPPALQTRLVIRESTAPVTQ